MQFPGGVIQTLTDRFTCLFLDLSAAWKRFVARFCLADAFRPKQGLNAGLVTVLSAQSVLVEPIKIGQVRRMKSISKTRTNARSSAASMPTRIPANTGSG